MKRAGDVFSSLFDEAMLAKADGYSSLLSCWKDLMEKNGIAAAASHSWIQSMDRGLVWVEVDHPGWKQLLQTKESKLLSDFRRRFPEMDISGMAIMLCRPGSSPKPPAAQEEAPPLPAAAPVADGMDAVSDADYEAIKDDALKAALMRLERSIAARE